MAGIMSGLSNVPSLVRRVGEAASKAKPFYSAVDEVISSLPNKALGDQFVKEMLKRGVKPQEIIDRNIDKILGAPIVQKTRTVNLKKPDAKGRTQIEEKYFEVTPSEKGSKSIGRVDVEKAATDNPPPQIFETTLRGPEEGNKYRAEYDDNSQRWEVMDDYSMPVARFDDEEDAIERAAKLNDSGTAKFADTEYVTKGGTNHREILFQLPVKGKPVGQIPSDRASRKGRNIYSDPTFQSQHYDEPNILAHARVSDRIGPNGEKILHVDEIQSDWHKKARDSRKKEIKRLVKNGMTEEDAKKAVPSDFGYSGNIKELPEGYKLEEFISPSGARAFRVNDPQGTLYSSGMSPESATKNAIENLNVGVPDAPFKSDWHELVMKRLLDDAARNGYDRVTITPGAEQAKRYGLSKQVDQIVWRESGGGIKRSVNLVMPGDRQITISVDDVGKVMGGEFNGKTLDEVVGKDFANKIMDQPQGNLSGEGLNIGGEGMIGFYDQMLPAFVNRYGEKTGLRMNLGNTPVDGKKYKVYEDSNAMPFSIVPEDGFTIAGRYATQEEADRAALAMGTQPHHSIDITPEFRESVTEKGQPLYQIGAGSAIGAAAASEEEPKQSANFSTFRKGGEVNLDAMLMAVTNKQLRKRHG